MVSVASFVARPNFSLFACTLISASADNGSFCEAVSYSVNFFIGEFLFYMCSLNSGVLVRLLLPNCHCTGALFLPLDKPEGV